jgi:hypothetical protein
MEFSQLDTAPFDFNFCIILGSWFPALKNIDVLEEAYLRFL